MNHPALAFAHKEGRAKFKITLVLLLTCALAATCLVCGYVGYSQDDREWDDALYYSLALFHMKYEPPKKHAEAQPAPPGAAAPKPPRNVLVDVARFAAAGAVFAPITLILAAALARTWNEVRIRTMRNRYVVVGLGTTGLGIVRALRQQGASVVVIEIDPDCQNAAAAYDLGALLVTGDGAEQTILAYARIRAARRLIVCTGSDATDLQVIHSARAVLSA